MNSGRKIVKKKRKGGFGSGFLGGLGGRLKYDNTQEKRNKSRQAARNKGK